MFYFFLLLFIDIFMNNCVNTFLKYTFSNCSLFSNNDYLWFILLQFQIFDLCVIVINTNYVWVFWECVKNICLLFNIVWIFIVYIEG